MTELSDSFNRADGGLGSNWTKSSTDALAIASNVVVGTSNHCVSYWSANTWVNDQYCQLTIGGAASRYHGAVVRHQSGSLSYYVMFANIAASQATIYRFDNGSGSLLGSVVGSIAWAAGDTMKLDVAGSTLTAYRNGGSIFTRSDATYTGGYPGIDVIAVAGTPTVDDWVAGPALVVPVFAHYRRQQAA